ncbi:MAG: trypsin-like peptidase domain-containing protein [Gammaproteobacteria bacterium]|nr:trypsin-like peptidase domain-containing protein [Gammaproteobacteria bacterium]
MQYMRNQFTSLHFLVAGVVVIGASIMTTLAQASGARTNGPVSYADAVERAAPAVVNVFSSRVLERQFAPRFNAPPGMRSNRRQREENRGSGVIVDAKGYIVTSSHVVQGADKIEVVLHSGERLQATMVGSDPDSGVAVLHIDLSDRSAKAGQLQVIALGASSSLRVGDVVLAIGNPFGVGQTVTMGVVSATGRSHLGISKFENFIQTDASINPGNSGGALIDAQGELVAINAAIFSRSGGSQGIGFAIPVDMVRGIMRQLLDTGRASRGWLGIGGKSMTAALAGSYGLKPDMKGVLISQVFNKGPAGEAGLRPGDVITRIDETPINSSFDIVNTVASKAVGSDVRIQGWRGAAPLDLAVTLQERERSGEEQETR